MIAAGHRGDEDHAGLVALRNVRDWGVLPYATVYTTLEPCTPYVRSNEGESCTNRLVRAGVKKVFIGILDPNQGVCGKGVIELQYHDIEVELFPHDLRSKFDCITMISSYRSRLWALKSLIRNPTLFSKRIRPMEGMIYAVNARLLLDLTFLQ